MTVLVQYLKFTRWDHCRYYLQFIHATKAETTRSKRERKLHSRWILAKEKPSILRWLRTFRRPPSPVVTSQSEGQLGGDCRILPTNISTSPHTQTSNQRCLHMRRDTGIVMTATAIHIHLSRLRRNLRQSIGTRAPCSPSFWLQCVCFTDSCAGVIFGFSQPRARCNVLARKKSRFGVCLHSPFHTDSQFHLKTWQASTLRTHLWLECAHLDLSLGTRAPFARF